MSKLARLLEVHGYALVGAPAGNIEGVALGAKKKAKARQPSKGEECEAKGLAMAAGIIGRHAGKSLDEATGHASYAHYKGEPGYTLQETDSGVRRWVKERAIQHIEAQEHDNKGVFRAIAEKLHLAKERSKPTPEHPTHHQYWLKGHAWLVKKAAGEHGLDEETVAHALAYLAHRHARGKDAKLGHKEIARSTIGDFLKETHRVKKHSELVKEGKEYLAELDSTKLRRLKALSGRLGDKAMKVLEEFGKDTGGARGKASKVSRVADHLLDMAEELEKGKAAKPK